MAGLGSELLFIAVESNAANPMLRIQCCDSLRFPNYLKACYRLTSCIPSFPTCFGIYSTWASSIFDALFLISKNGFGSTNFSTAFRLRNCPWFSSLFSFFYFSLWVSIVFLDVFFASLPSLTHSFPPPPRSRQEGTTICFAPNHSFDY